MNYPSNEEVEKRFDERFVNRNGNFNTKSSMEAMWSFISNIRLSDLDAIIEIVEDVRDKNHTKVNEALDDMVVRLTSLKENKL